MVADLEQVDSFRCHAVDQAVLEGEPTGPDVSGEMGQMLWGSFSTFRMGCTIFDQGEHAVDRGWAFADDETEVIHELGKREQA